MARFIQNRHSLNIKTNDSNNLGNVFRYSYPNSKKDILYPEFDISIKRSNTMVVSKRLSNESNKSVESQDSGIGLSKADYEIRRAIKAQRVVERPHIIVIQKGKPIMTNYNNYIEDPDADAHMVISAATASKRHRREIAVMQKRNTMTSSSSSSSPSLSSSSSSLSPQPSLYYYNPEKENVFNGFEFTRNNIETDVIEENIYSGKRKPRGCSFLKHKASIKKVSSALKKFVGKEKGFIACVYA